LRRRPGPTSGSARRARAAEHARPRLVLRSAAASLRTDGRHGETPPGCPQGVHNGSTAETTYSTIGRGLHQPNPPHIVVFGLTRHLARRTLNVRKRGAPPTSPTPPARRKRPDATLRLTLRA